MDTHVNAHIGAQAQRAASIIAFDQAQFGQHLDVFVDTLDVAADAPGQFPHSQRALPQQGSDQRPASFGQPAEERSRTLEVQRLALVPLGLCNLARSAQSDKAYETVITANDEERRDLFLGAAARLGTAVQNVEKDFWVCWTLDALFNGLDASGPRLLFKGGTSLEAPA